MNKKCLLRSLLSTALCIVSLISVRAHAACTKEGGSVTLEGIAMSRATYIDPGDFGWAPKNGFESYVVIVLQNPICIQSTGNDGGAPYETSARILQLGWSDSGNALSRLSAKDLQSGVRVTVTGQAFPAETAHHFEDLVMMVSSSTIQSDR